MTGEVVVAPGDVITIAGQYFAAAPVSATKLPLTTTLAGTEVLFAGAPLPLIYSSSGKILAVVPYNIAPNAQYQLLVGQGGAISGPTSVTLGTAEPDILQIVNTTDPAVSKNLWSLLTAGTAFNLATAGPATAMKPGDPLVIYCTGLGAINQTLAPGQPAPLTPVSTVNTVSVSIGGQNVPVTFAGLVPGYPALYQITGTVPASAPAGKNIPITVSVAGVTSAAVQVAVQ